MPTRRALKSRRRPLPTKRPRTNTRTRPPKLSDRDPHAGRLDFVDPCGPMPKREGCQEQFGDSGKASRGIERGNTGALRVARAPGRGAARNGECAGDQQSRRALAEPPVSQAEYGNGCAVVPVHGLTLEIPPTG